MTDADDQHLRQRAASLRILAGALFVGVVLIATLFVVVHYSLLDGKPLIDAGPDGLPVCSLVVSVFGVAGILAGQFLVRQMRARAAEATVGSPTHPLAGHGSTVPERASAYAGSAIVGLAPAEAAAILGSLAFLLEGHWLAAVPVGLGILTIAWTFPSEADLRSWIQQ